MSTLPRSGTAFVPRPPRPPPPGTIGVLGWLRANLFYSVTSTLVTALTLALVTVTFSHLFEWGVVNAVWIADSRRECQDRNPDGACWAGVGAWANAFVHGRYPRNEQWRVSLAFGLAIAWLAPLWWSRVKDRLALGAGAVVSLPIIAGHLLLGGERGWLMGLLVPAATGVLAVSALHVTLCLGTGRSLADCIGRVGAGMLAIVVAVVAAAIIGDAALALVKTNRWGGLFLTFLIAAIAMAVSLPGGVLLALLRRSRLTFIRAVVIAYIELTRSVPLVTVLFFAVTMVPLFTPADVVVDKLLLALGGICLFACAYMAEVVRGGLQSVPLGQLEAAQSLGLGYQSTMLDVVLPQALRNMIPNIASSFIGLLKDTTIIAIVGLYDFLLMLRAAGQNSVWLGLHKEVLLLGAAVYFLLCLGVSRYGHWLERRMRRD